MKKQPSESSRVVPLRAAKPKPETADAAPPKKTAAARKSPVSDKTAAPENTAAPRAARGSRRRATKGSAAAQPGSPIAIYQIHYETQQASSLDPAFIALDNAGHDDREREFAVFERLAANPDTATHTLWGAVSWRFGQKTGIGGTELLRDIEQHPGMDLYYCNPNPHCEALYGNFWLHGATTHPSFREVVEAFLQANGVDADEFLRIEPSGMFSSCNYFVGSQAFWSAYLPFVRALIERARREMPAAMLQLADSRMSDPNELHPGATYWPFIIERLLPLFLRGPGAGLKTRKVPLPTIDARLNAHQRRLREMKDVAHRTKSAWLYSCWIHYRNLYLLQVAGRDWCQRNLPGITPARVVFG